VTVLDASVAIKWFVADEPGAEAAWDVLRTIEADPRSFVVPDLFMTEVLAVLARLPDATPARVAEALALLEALGLARFGNGHQLLAEAARIAVAWGLSGYDATYVALARLVRGAWLTADERAARRVRVRRLVRLLGR